MTRPDPEGLIAARELEISERPVIDEIRTATADATAIAFRSLVREVLEDVAGPALDFATAVREATDLEDDAAVGRRVRELVQAYAAARIDRESERSARNQAGSASSND
jgi:hypothetical protein